MTSTTNTAPRLAAGRKLLSIVLVAALAAGCAPMPTAPMVAVMPGPYKPFEVFTQDDQLCRGWAAHSIGIPGNEAAAQAILGSTALGAAIGALAGAALGGHRGAGGGAAVGATMGAVAGTGAGVDASWGSQRRYDIAYQQCMYSKGNVVPLYGYRSPPSAQVPPPPPPPAAPR